MPKLTVQGIGEFDIAAGKRLVKAMVEDAGTDQLHACGGNSRCTTCRVRFIDGEPTEITEAEAATLSARGITDAGIRLSCQIVCEHDMTVELISRLDACLRRAGRCSDQRAQVLFPTSSSMLDCSRRELLIGKRSIHLTPYEFEVLHLLVRHPGKVLSPNAILTRVWGPGRLGESELVTLFWINEHFNPDDPDTFFEKV